MIVSEGEPKSDLKGDKSDGIPNRLAYPGPVGTALQLISFKLFGKYAGK